MGRPRKWGVFTVQETVESAFENAVCEIECLRDEVIEWKDGMEGTGLENTYKYQMLEDAETSLESVDELQSSNLNEYELLSDMLEIEIDVSQIKKKRLARHHRLSNAINQLQAVLDTVEGLIDETNDNINDDVHNVNIKESELQKISDKVDHLEELKQQIEDSISEFENVEFPGMYS